MAIYPKPTEVADWATSRSIIADWQPSTAYEEGVLVSNGGAIYKCTDNGTSASSGSGPTGTSSSITDGTVVWSYSSPSGTAGPVVEPSATQKSLGFSTNPNQPPQVGVLNWLFAIIGTWVRYLQSFTAQTLSWAARQTFSQTVTAANDAGTAWQASTAYPIDTIRNNDSGKIYIVTTAGTSAGSGGPTGTGSSITDGTVVWKYLRGPAPAVEGTSTVTGQAGVRGVGTATGTAAGVAVSGVLLLEGLATDPSSPANGHVWHNTTSNTIKARLNGATVTLTTS